MAVASGKRSTLGMVDANKVCAVKVLQALTVPPDLSLFCFTFNALTGQSETQINHFDVKVRGVLVYLSAVLFSAGEPTIDDMHW